MAALTAPRSTVRDNRPVFRASFPIAANVEIYQGALVQLNAGYATPAGVATQSDSHTFLTVGRAIATYNNTNNNLVSGNTAAACEVEVEFGIDYWDILSSDAPLTANLGAQVYAEDDHTVRLTSNSTTRAVAGRLLGLVTLPGYTAQQAQVFTIPGTP